MIVLQCNRFSRYNYSHFAFGWNVLSLEMSVDLAWWTDAVQELCPSFRPSHSSESLEIRAVQTPSRACPALTQTHSLVSKLFPLDQHWGLRSQRRCRSQLLLPAPAFIGHSHCVLRPLDEFMRMFISMLFVIAKCCWIFRHRGIR